MSDFDLLNLHSVALLKVSTWTLQSTFIYTSIRSHLFLFYLAILWKLYFESILLLQRLKAQRQSGRVLLCYAAKPLEKSFSRNPAGQFRVPQLMGKSQFNVIDSPQSRPEKWCLTADDRPPKENECTLILTLNTSINSSNFSFFNHLLNEKKVSAGLRCLKCPLVWLWSEISLLRNNNITDITYCRFTCM